MKPLHKEKPSYKTKAKPKAKPKSKVKKVPIIEASLEDAQGSKIITNNSWQHLIVVGKPVYVLTKGNAQTGSRAGNPMLTLMFEVDDGEFKEARISNHNLMVGGLTKDGKPMPIRGFREMVSAMALEGVPWTCKGCGQETDLPFERTASGEHVCPNCHQICRFSTNPDLWEGRRINGLCTTGKYQGSDEPRNELSRVRPYSELVESSS